ncbi:nuclear transport factor 2 family protein [Streptomyces griseorubiginosus]|uniref:nuclear transport factor 2 family protein n=1 Tax=Streptomyces griseorubiginosus TaxID=67304 RepID=UPI0015E82C3B|nr:nuclear transport factor 2 family protein [Streptomyces griseorubiginosus]
MTTRDMVDGKISGAVTAAGIDHVRLSYHYLDIGDIDGYGSLLADDIRVVRPDAPLRAGREEVLSLHQDSLVQSGTHHIEEIVAEGRSVVVTGRLTPQSASCTDGPARDLEFVDWFTLTDDSMLRGYRRYYFAAPS